MDDVLTHLLAMAVLVAFAGYAFYWQRSRAGAILLEWATQNGYRILSSEFRYLRKGPFFWTSSKGQAVFYVSVRDRENRIRSGFVCCGGWWIGLWSDQAKVKWDDGSA